MAAGKHNLKIKNSLLVDIIGEYFDIEMNHFFFMLSFHNFLQGLWKTVDFISFLRGWKEASDV